MTTHAAPFTGIRTLPADLAIGAWLVFGVAGAETLRPWLARMLTAWGARLG